MSGLWVVAIKTFAVSLCLVIVNMAITTTHFVAMSYNDYYTYLLGLTSAMNAHRSYCRLP